MELRGLRALVTGATGFVGGQLARRLQLEEGVAVRALARTPAKAQALAELGVEVVQGDVMDDRAVRQAVAGCQLVFHVAAYVGESGDKDQVRAVNVGGARRVATEAAAAGMQRFVHLSSCAVYGSLQRLDIDETTPPRKTGRAYHDSKVEAEEVVFACHHNLGLPVVVARPSQVYGPGSPQLTMRVVKAIKARQVFLIDGGRHLFKPIYIDNLIDGLVRCAQVDAAVGQAINLTDGVTVPWRQFFAAYGRMLGVQDFPSVPYAAAWLFGLFSEIKGALRGKPSSLNRDIAKTFRSHNSFSNAKARALLDWRPQVGFEEGMQRTEAWLRANGYLDPRNPA